ncbi:conserved hypothetical protein [Ricinus communis]|uniref:Uncharacterized protein n=1 Tax=Ricinus communis TaxID=3988 RepID=B9TQJ7_RICCO|nr:conserved hypothetical protein [Ricinus communis]
MAAPRFIVGAGDRGQVDVQLCRQLALRRKPVARFQCPVRHRRLQRIGDLQEARTAVRG